MGLNIWLSLSGALPRGGFIFCWADGVSTLNPPGPYNCVRVPDCPLIISTSSGYSAVRKGATSLDFHCSRSLRFFSLVGTSIVSPHFSIWGWGYDLTGSDDPIVSEFSTTGLGKGFSQIQELSVVHQLGFERSAFGGSLQTGGSAFPFSSAQ